MPKIHIPLSVPHNKEKDYLENFNLATRGTGRMLMLAADQKVEHLNRDFVGPDIPKEVSDPEHFFKIAQKAKIGVLSTQLGLIDKYGRDYPQIPHLVKVNSKTNILRTVDKDPFGNLWYDLEDIVDFKKQTNLNIVGVGYTVYVGSWFESDMFRQAAELIFKAHRFGLITALWMYPRGKAVQDEKDIEIIAGAAGVAVCLGADFAKMNYPYGRDELETAKEFKQVVNAAGRTRIICIGGSKKETKSFLEALVYQRDIAGTRGAAIGRNIFQRPINEAVRMANAISAIVSYGYSAEDAHKIFKGQLELKEKVKK